MITATPNAAQAQKASGGFAPRPIENVWRAPLVPLAIAGTIGIVVDRSAPVPMLFSFLVIIASMAAWIGSRLGKQQILGAAYLWLGTAGLGALYHHVHQQVFPRNDIGNYAAAEPHAVHLRGTLDEEPTVAWQPKDDPLQSFSRSDST
jgi:competence protein ComEC